MIHVRSCVFYTAYRVTMYESNWNLVLELLESEIWIDKLTRAVFVELVIANMNVNVFSQIKIVFETPVLGGRGL